VLQVVSSIDALKLAGDEFSVLGVYGGERIDCQIVRLKQGVDIVVATPGRLIDMIKRRAICLGDIQVTCLDEADEMLKQGFQDDIEFIFKEIRETRKAKTQNLLFSATFPEWVNTLSAKYQSSDTQMVDLVSKESEMPTTITHYLIPHDGRMADLVHKLIAHFTTKGGKTIIFCETKSLVNALYEEIGAGCAMLHGDVRQCDRERIYRDFKTGSISTIVATNVAARGLDFPDIQLVIQTEPPREIESFIHRSGRTGRAGKSGVNVLIYSKKQGRTLEKIQGCSKISFRPLAV
jgi:ATP-dependent RNA helicase DDX21